MKKIFNFIIILMLLFICSSCSDIKTNSIKDDMLDIYEFVIPFDDIYGEYSGSLSFEKDDLTLDELGKVLKEKGYLIEKSKDYNENDILLVNYNDNNRNFSIFMIQQNRYNKNEEENVFFVTPLVSGVNNINYSCPEHFIFRETVVLEDNNYEIITHINKNFEELIEFYNNNSLSEVYELDEENKKITIKAIDKKVGKEFNKFVIIKYIEDNENHYIEFEIVTDEK